MLGFSTMLDEVGAHCHRIFNASFSTVLTSPPPYYTPKLQAGLATNCKQNIFKLNCISAAYWCRKVLSGLKINAWINGIHCCCCLFGVYKWHTTCCMIAYSAQIRFFDMVVKSDGRHHEGQELQSSRAARLLFLSRGRLYSYSVNSWPHYICYGIHATNRSRYTPLSQLNMAFGLQRKYNVILY